MKGLLTRIKALIQKTPHAWMGLLIFCTCVFVYLSNGEAISSTDNFPSSLLAFNWLDNHSLNFDIFRNGNMHPADTKAEGVPYFFVESTNGHLTSTYPIGNVILTFPIYFLFFIGIKAAEFYQHFVLGNSIDFLRLADPSFEESLQGYQKLAATGVASFSTVLFYLANRLKFNGAIALLSTFIFAFATSTWMTGSQGLWQHGSSNLTVLCIIFCLLKANRTQGKNRKILLVLTGIFCGLLPGIRSTSLLYSVAAIAYAFVAYRKEALYLLIGLPSALISAAWNIYYFGFSLSKLVVGGYSRFSDKNISFASSYYSFTVKQFLTGFWGLLISPSRGILAFTPVSLLAIPGAGQVWQWRAGKDEKLFLCLTIAAIGIFLQYCFFKIWAGGACYGPRYLADILPIVCFLISYCLVGWVEKWKQGKSQFTGVKLTILTLLIAFSTFTQTVGAFGSTNWDAVPEPVASRLWQLQDGQIERHTRHIFYKVFDPLGDRDRYLKNWNGVIESVYKRNAKPLKDVLEVTPSRKLALTAQVKNTGQVPWIGYETGLSRGRTQVGIEFFDSNNQPVRTKAGQRNRLYVSGMPQPGETAIARGRVVFPQKPGNYKLVLELGVGGIKKPADMAKSTYVLEARVVAAP